MNTKKIKKLENKIKDLHLNPILKNHSMVSKSTKEAFSLFWVLHLKPVIEHSKELAKKYKANLETVWLSAILHDLARLDDVEPHDEIGSEKAYRILLKGGFSKEIAEEVKNIILTHRCKKYKPKTLEQKILATTDATNHFKAPIYLYLSSISPKPFKKQLESYLKKLERDYNKKIFFEEEKELIKKEYEVLKKWLQYYSKIP